MTLSIRSWKTSDGWGFTGMKVLTGRDRMVLIASRSV